MVWVYGTSNPLTFPQVVVFHEVHGFSTVRRWSPHSQWQNEGLYDGSTTYITTPGDWNPGHIKYVYKHKCVSKQLRIDRMEGILIRKGENDVRKVCIE